MILFAAPAPVARALDGSGDVGAAWPLSLVDGRAASGLSGLSPARLARATPAPRCASARMLLESEEFEVVRRAGY